MELDKKIESILFFKGEPVSIKKLAEILNVKERDIKTSLEILKSKLENRGISLIELKDEVTLGTSPENTDIIENIKKEELNKNLGRAGIETLTIIIYMGPISKPKIDFVRGVNSVAIVRNLLIRGLIKKKINQQDKRVYLYEPTVEALSYTGITSLEELPEYNDIRKRLLEFDSEETSDSI